ncbi:MAG: class I SAM-dependent methyltransferase [Terriglobia bacterium]
MSRISRLYESLITASLNGVPPWLPPAVQRFYINLNGYERAEAVRRLVGDKHRVLLVGDAGGRDYYFLRLAGKSVVVADIAMQSNLPDLILADAARGLPFPPASFDAVVMADVLEHFLCDVDALAQVRAVLRDDGYLILTVPYYHDASRTHVRLHSPATLERLLAAAGFRIVECVERGGLMNLERLRFWPWLWHGLHFLLWKLTGRTQYRPLLRVLVGVDWWLGRRRFRPLGWTAYYGGQLRCQKARPVDFHQQNVEDFTDRINRVTGQHQRCDA